MDAVTNITTATSEATFGEAGEEVKHGEAGRGEPVSGQMGNVAAGEPYDRGNLETQRHVTAPTYGTADSKAANLAAAEQVDAAVTGKKSLYNPILPVGPAENGPTDYTSSDRRAPAISTDSRNLGEQRSPFVQGVGEPEGASGSGTGQQNGITYDESNMEARRPSDSGPAFPTREGGRRRSRQNFRCRSIDRPGQIEYGSMLGEAYLKKHERNALAPLNKTEQARRRAAQEYSADHKDDLETRHTNISIIKQEKLSLKGRIKAMF